MKTKWKHEDILHVITWDKINEEYRCKIADSDSGGPVLIAHKDHRDDLVKLLNRIGFKVVGNSLERKL